MNVAANYRGMLLHLALQSERLDIARALIRKGANVRVRDIKGQTPLDLAVRGSFKVWHRDHIRQWLRVVRLLESADRRKNRRNGVFTTLISYCFPCFWGLARAAREGNAIAVSRILKRKPGLAQVRNRQGETPLLVAVTFGHQNVVSALYSAGADIQCRDMKGRSLLWRAAHFDRKDLVSLLVEWGCDIDLPNDSDEVPLSAAVTAYNPTMVRLLLRLGANPNQEPPKFGGGTPLHKAALGGNPEIVGLLLEAGADPRVRTTSGDLPLHSAMFGGKLGIVRLMIELGIDVNTRGSMGRTALHFLGQDSEILRFLLDCGADIHSRNSAGGTALHQAGSPEMVSILLSRGADFQARVQPGPGALPPSPHGPKAGETPLHRAVDIMPRYNDEVVAALIRSGADVHAVDDEGRTPLHVALSWGCVGIVRLLLAAGADLYAQDSNGRTPLDYARFQNRPDVIQLLQTYERA